ncbi:MAG: hypothetical protein WC661_03330 [Opitutaceae bacterium]|jgi:hypothetical protein
MTPDILPSTRTLRRFGVGGVLLSLSLLAATAQIPADAVRLVGFDKPFTTVEADWAGKARVADAHAVLEGCGSKGSATYEGPRDFFAQGDAALALYVKVGPRNTATTLRLRLRDEDQHECEWSFALPKPGAGFEWAKAQNGAFLLLPNQPDLRDYSINDLRRISRITLLGIPEENRVLDVQVAGIFALKPDAETLAARAPLLQNAKKKAADMRNRDSLSARYVANFPELNVPAPAPIAGQPVLRGYHIGNSLTFKALSYPYAAYKKPWSITAYEERVLAFMKQRGVHYVPGWHVSWGASLPSLWSNRFNPAVANAGVATKALSDYTWDLLTLQLWGADTEGDVSASKNFIALAVAKNPAVQVFLVETWVEKNDKLDFPTQWNREWKADQKYGIPPIHCGAYSRTVFANLKKATADLRKPVKFIPIGTVLYELDKRMRAGTVPGFTRVEELYQDKVHLNETGNYVALETFYTVMLGRNPKGLPRTDLFPTVTDAFGAIVQDAIWQVVTSMPETGVVTSNR